MEGPRAESSFAIYSQHVILPSELEPVSAVIIVEGEQISRVVKVSSGDIERLMAVEYKHLILLNYSNLYVSPGLVDINISFNTPARVLEAEYMGSSERKFSYDIDISSHEGWEGYFYGTMTAAAGGVTTIIESPTVTEADMEFAGMIRAKRDYLSGVGLYCDVGLFAHINPNNIGQIAEISEAGVIGFKGFVVPPGPDQAYFSFAELNAAMVHISATGKPLMLYSTMTTKEQIFKFSPFRNSFIHDRAYMKTPEFSSGFAAAYGEDVDGSSDSDSETPTRSMNRTMSFTMLVGSLSGGLDNEMLNKAVDRIHRNHETLMLAEASTYKSSGSTIFKAQSASLPPLPNLLGKPRAMRPISIVCTPDIKLSRNQSYSGFLANYPLDWEKRGASAMLNLLERVPECKVHLTRLSSAVTLHLLNKAKEENPHLKLSFDIAATHIFFSSNSIRDGDTRFKHLPPIRDEENKLLLVEFLNRGAIECVTSSHRLIKPALKFMDRGSFARAIEGISCSGLTLQATWMLLGGCDDKKLPLLAKLLSQKPADVVNLGHIKGSIAEGKLADFVIWNPHETFLVDGVSVPMKHPNMNVFSGMLMKGRVYSVFCRGKQSFSPPTFAPCGKLL
mmetsp:Transcript_25708/g.45096  ORF Transcript_25708/g.45096 Transcript_25708/m.45096 type:complete len:618 (+) Transcript_25708:1109-2962(+)